MRFDPETRAIQAFHREDGLQGEEFASGAFFRLRDGRLAFGGPGGFNVFAPAKTHGEPASAAHRDHRGICARSPPRCGQAFVAARLARARLPSHYRVTRFRRARLRFSAAQQARVSHARAHRHVDRSGLAAPGDAHESRRGRPRTRGAGRNLRLRLDRAAVDPRHPPRAGAVALRLGVRRIRAACIRRHRGPHPTTTAEVHRGGTRTRAARARGATAHARARRQQPAARRSGAREEQLSRSDEPRAAHPDERCGRHDGAAFAHASLRDSDASHADNPFFRADPAADRQRLARPVEDSRRQGHARVVADRSRPGARGMHKSLRGIRRVERPRAHRLSAGRARQGTARRPVAGAADPHESRGQRSEVHREG